MDCTSEKKVRRALATFCAALSVVLSAIVWIMLDASSNAASSALMGSLALVVGATIVTQIIYALKGPIFEFDGSLAKQEILFAVICFQLVMQLGFGFSLYAVKQTDLQNASFDDAYAFFTTLQQSAGGNTAKDYQNLDMKAAMPECVEEITHAGGDDQSGADGYFRFPISDGVLMMKKSERYFLGRLKEFALSLVMSLVVSILLMAEMVFFAVKHIEHRRCRADVCPSEYLRQIAFLFYFAGYLSTSFIPIMARDLCGNNPNADFIAGLPYSVEALTNCIAILLSTWIFRRKGWKPPFAAGVGLFVIGLLASAASPDIFSFLASRALTGAGYGFCWMTLRNVATLSGDRAERFAGLFSGIYAGIMCGVAFGAVLADLIGYKAVLLVSAAMTLVAVVFPMTLRNDKGTVSESDGRETTLSPGDICIFVVFMALIAVPTCIAEAFRGYVLPLYVNKLELSTAYIGRVSLVYNLCLVYVGSTIVIKLVKRFIKNALFQSAPHLVVISLALFAAAYAGGLQGMIIAAALLGSADGFGFSVQNAFIVETRISKKIGSIRMLTWFSLLKKFGAMLGPPVFGLFIMNGFQGLGAMGAAFMICFLLGMPLLILFQKHGERL